MFVGVTQTQTSGRGRITLDWDKAHELRDVFDDYLKEIAKLGDLPQDEEDQKQVKSAAIRQGKRRYFVDLRENTRGRFVKVCDKLMCIMYTHYGWLSTYTMYTVTCHNGILYDVRNSDSKTISVSFVHMCKQTPLIHLVSFCTYIDECKQFTIIIIIAQ